MPLKVKSVASGWVKSGKFSTARGGSRSASNPLPVGRFVPARVKRLSTGDIQLLLEQQNPKKRKKTTTKKAKKRTSPKRRPASKKTKRSAKKSKR